MFQSLLFTQKQHEKKKKKLECVWCGAMQFIIGYSSRANSLSPMKRIPAVINYVKSCVRRTGHKLIWQIFYNPKHGGFFERNRIHSLFCYYWFGFYTNYCQKFLQIHVIIAKICTCLNGSWIEIDSTQKCIEPKKNHFEPDLLHLSKKQSSRTSNYALGSHHVPGIRKSDIY